MKEFNTTAICIPEENYMVDLSSRIMEIAKLVEAKKYFTVNRARQYGKTTTLTALENYLSDRYDVIPLDFQDMTDDMFRDEDSFVKGVAQVLCDARDTIDIPVKDEVYEQFAALAKDERKLLMNDLFRVFDQWCRENEKPVVLIIDEVDSATNNQVFLDFLGKLRSNYLKRKKKHFYKTFQSVILAGVTDVKHLRGKIRQEDQRKLNSPWNIAADFDIDMSLSESGITGMLDEYEADHHTGMDTALIAKKIREYTNGYPYLVSRICQIMDQKLVPDQFDNPHSAWTEYGVDEAVRRILSEESTLFESLMGKLELYPTLKGQLRRILLQGETIAHLPDDEEQKQLRMFGFIENHHNTVVVANRIFEMRLYQYFIGESRQNETLKQLAAADRSIFITEDGMLDIPVIMAHFIEDHNRIHGFSTEKFMEEEGRERFITYIAPIINGTGTYSVEEQSRDRKRMDLVIHYRGRRYIIELKIWHGDRYNEKGEKQILGYLERFGLQTGYMLSFNFNRKKEPGVHRVNIGNRVLFEGIV